jgi:hypothetical protein
VPDSVTRLTRVILFLAAIGSLLQPALADAQATGGAVTGVFQDASGGAL